VNREQKAAFIEDVAARVEEADAIFAIDYRGITVSQVADLRTKLREADATFQVVKNTLTLRALDQVGNDTLKDFLEGPTAFTYVRGDVALAAKTLNNFARELELLDFKGGEMEGQIVSVEQFQALTKLPSRDVLLGRLVGMVASPITGVARGLNALLSGVAVQLGQIQEQGLVGSAAPAEEAAPAEAAPAEEAPADEAAADAEAPSEEAPSEEAPTEEPAAEEAPAEEAADEAPAQDAAEVPASEEPAEAEAEATPETNSSAEAEAASSDEAEPEAESSNEAEAEAAPGDDAE
jgi:large subunit ribosomal protein L10